MEIDKESGNKLKILLIHDTTTVGFITGAVFANLLSRQHNEVIVYADPDKTKRAMDFWRIYVDKLPLEGIDRIVLCCLPFDDKDEKGCFSKLKALEEQIGKPPIILSHRWPDAYERSGFKLMVPPIDLINNYSKLLKPSERELLRLILIYNRQANPEKVSDEDIDISDRLGTVIWQEPEEYWGRLRDDPSGVLSALQSNKELGVNNSSELTDVCTASGAGYQLFHLNPDVPGHAEKRVEALLKSNNASDDTLGLGILELDDSPRAYIVRAWGSKLPSVEFLLEQYATQYGLPKASDWFGAQDAKALHFGRPDPPLPKTDLQKFIGKLLPFAGEAAKLKHGERYPIATLNRLIHFSASEALWSLDLCRKHTNDPVTPNLAFDPVHARIHYETSNRNGLPRETLVLRLLARTAPAAAFLFKYGGYNLLKLERLLEGVLIGLRDQLQWLGLSVPGRLRIDVRLSNSAIDALSNNFTSVSEVATLPLQTAITKGLIGEKSSIAKALRKFKPKANQDLIIYRESETIGPSVQYVLTARALAEVLAEEKAGELDVLDLFSGSGLLARVLLRHNKHWQMYCVDLTTGAKQAGFQRDENIVWLNADVSAVLGGTKGILERDFDLVCLDPPHTFLFELLFSSHEDKTLIQKVSELTKWILVYQGHSSQRGRSAPLARTLKAAGHDVVSVRVGSEVMTIAGPPEWNERSFGDVIGKAREELVQMTNDYGWEVSVDTNPCTET